MYTILDAEIKKIFQLATYREEATKKLVGTYMLVNGVPIKIKEFNWGYNKVRTEDDKHIKIETIKPWLPTSGIYVDEWGNYLFLSKSPKKQWKLSYSNDIYRTKLLHLQSEEFFNLVNLLTYKKVRVAVLPNMDVYIRDKKVGYVQGKDIICTNTLYKQELMDWVRDETRTTI